MNRWAEIMLIVFLLANGTAYADLFGTLNNLNSALTGTANAGSPGTVGSVTATNGFAESTLTMSDNDKAQIRKKIRLEENLPANHGILAKDIKEAEDQIEPVIELAATATGNLCSLEQRYARPGNFNCQFIAGSDSTVFMYMQNTPKTQPLQVVSISNWSLQTANAFQFYVNFCSNISQVCHSVGYGFSNMGDGWMLGVLSPY